MAICAHMRIHSFRAIAILAALSTLTPGNARAWYFPEHAELTRLALRDFAPSFVSDEINAVLRDARAVGLMVCADASIPLRSVPSYFDRAACVPYGVLAAIAGDHANDVTELARELKRPEWRLWPGLRVQRGLLLTEASQRTWIKFQNSAPSAPRDRPGLRLTSGRREDSLPRRNRSHRHHIGGGRQRRRKQCSRSVDGAPHSFVTPRRW